MSSLDSNLCRVTPSTKAIHSASTAEGRTFYYSSLNLEWSTEQKWKVHLGDLVAVSLVNPGDNHNDSTTKASNSKRLQGHYIQVIQNWKANHYQKPSPHWKVGLVIALRKQIFKDVLGESFECHVQWLDKAMDLSAQESNPFKKQFRPFSARQGKSGSQLPHILINRPGDFGVVNPLDILPVTIVLLSKHEFSGKGVLEGDESQYSLRFCCLKTRREKRLGQRKLDTQVLNEPNPDVWTFANPPALKNQGNQSIVSFSVPEPLEKAWEMWLSTLHHDSQCPLLREGLRIGWAFNRRQRHQKTVLEAQAKEPQQIERIDKNPASRRVKSLSTTEKHRRNSSERENLETSQTKQGHETISSKKRKSFQIAEDRIERSSIPTKRKGIRFSEDTKHEKRIDSSTKFSTVSSSTTTQRKRPRSISQVQPKAKGTQVNEDEEDGNSAITVGGTGSMATQETHSTDTTIRTNGAGRKHYKESKYAETENDGTTDNDMNSSSDYAMLPMWNDDPLPGTPLHVSCTGIKYYKSLVMRIGYNELRRTLSDDVAMRAQEASASTELVFGFEIGSVVALYCRQAQSVNDSWFPFQVPWSFAQVTRIQLLKSDGNAQWDWNVGIKWFRRYSELTKTQQKLLPEKSRKADRLIETKEITQCSATSILPARVELTSDEKAVAGLPIVESCANGLPVIRMVCEHTICKRKQKIGKVSDWSFGYLQSTTGTSQSTHVHSGPLKRAVDTLPKELKSKYWNQQQAKSVLVHNTESPVGKSTPYTVPLKPSKSVTVCPATSTLLYEQWGKQFYDLVRLIVDNKVLHSTFSPKCGAWTLSVGHVIPVLVEYKVNRQNMEKIPSHPFTLPWCPAQVVALYKDESGAWMMQIRWFQRFCDILDHHKAALRHLDQNHVVFETEVYDVVPVEIALPGRLVMTSNEGEDHWIAWAASKTGLPMIPQLCTHMCLDEEIVFSRDWTNYDVTLPLIPAPLLRGLELKPANRTNKKWIAMLFRYYSKSISSRTTDPDHDDLHRFSASCKVDSVRSRTCQIFDSCKIECQAADPVALSVTGSNTEFFRSMLVKTQLDYLTKPTTEMTHQKNYSFKCSIGDVVCFYDENLLVAPNCSFPTGSKKSWYPFNVPWSFGQLLCIEKGLGPDLSTYVELRRFFRPNEIPSEATNLTHSVEKSEVAEIFESDEILERVDAGRILGLAKLFFDHGTANGRHRENSKQCVAKARCTQFFLKAFNRLQPIYCSSPSDGFWRRGLELSMALRKNENLKNIMLCSSKDDTPQSNILALLSPRNSSATEGYVAKVGKEVRTSRDSRVMYLDVVLHPRWSSVCSHLIFRSAQVNKLTWRLSIGDFVAVESHDKSFGTATYPYATTWVPCQLLSIAGEMHNLRCEVRFLQIETAIDGMQEIIPMNKTITETIGVSALLGPVVLHFRDGTTSGEIPVHLPSARFWASRSFDCSLRTAFALSNAYSMDDIQRLLAFLDTEKMAVRSSGLQTRGDSWTVGDPFRVDLSQGRAFYKAAGLTPQFGVVEARGATKQQNDPITIRVGDVVLVRYEGSRRFPFDCNWGIADIVSIFSETKLTDYVRQSSAQNGRTQVEVRWFYERQDIAGISVPSSSESTREVFETDQTQILDAGSFILSTAELTDSAPVDRYATQHNIFFCNRFWSTQRKSLIPCTGLRGRKKRAILYSKCLLSDHRAGQTHESCPLSILETSNGWEAAMMQLQQNLTLKDASKRAYGGGEILVGREKEMEELLSFFRAAIRGDEGVGGMKSSLIVAGPPGVGKTASVNSAISKLRLEYEQGIIPNFQFIGLNGMEQRHPFDVYIRFWEALSGKKHVGSHDRACELLDEYFSKGSSFSSKTIVVLLDEIDYLITERQCVLYNFFDWPKQAANAKTGRRLVVVGLSNTLNLVDQLIPSVQSRVGTEKCIFTAYSLKDTVNILQTKIREASQEYNFFEDDAILFAAKKTAALSGDIRKAFQICRVAADAVTQRFLKENGLTSSSYPTIKISDVQKASQESFNKALVTAVSFCTPHQALFLVSLASLCRTTGREVGEFDIHDIITKMVAIASASGDSQYSSPPNFNETIHLMNLLGEMNLVELKTGKSISCHSAWPMTSLVVDELTLLKGFKQTPHKELAQTNLSSML